MVNCTAIHYVLNKNAMNINIDMENMPKRDSVSDIELCSRNKFVLSKSLKCLEDLKSGDWTNGFTDGIGKCLAECEELCFEYNFLPPSRKGERKEILRRIFCAVGEHCIINPPFRCDFGKNIRIGDNFTGNFNLTILDEAEVVIGNNVFIGPNTSLCTVIHSLDPEARNNGVMCAHPIYVEDNVWIAANVVVLPGITIGKGAVIGAGSVVTKDVPPFTLVAGNPARVIRKITF